jgi:hypothetical protein
MVRSHQSIHPQFKAQQYPHLPPNLSKPHTTRGHLAMPSIASLRLMLIALPMLAGLVCAAPLAQADDQPTATVSSLPTDAPWNVSSTMPIATTSAVPEDAAVPCDSIDTYNTAVRTLAARCVTGVVNIILQWFIANRCKTPPASSVLFYTRGLSKNARIYAKSDGRAMTTIWVRCALARTEGVA